MTVIFDIIYCGKKIINYYKSIISGLNLIVFYSLFLSLVFLSCFVLLILIKYIGCYFKALIFISMFIFVTINIWDLFYINESYIHFKNKVLEEHSLWDFYYEKNLPYRVKDFYFDLKNFKLKYLYSLIFFPFFLVFFLIERFIRSFSLLILISSILTAVLTKQDKEYVFFLEEDVIESFSDVFVVFFTMSLNSCFIKIYSIRGRNKVNVQCLIENLIFNKSIGKSKFFINTFIYFMRFIIENDEIIRNSPKKKNYENIKWLTLRNINFFLSKNYVMNVIPFCSCKIIVKKSKIIINMKHLITGIMHHSKEVWNQKEQLSLLKAQIMIGNVEHEGKVIIPERGKVTQAWVYTSKPYYQIKKLMLSSFINSFKLGDKTYQNIESIDDYKYEVYLEEQIHTYQYLVPSYVQDEQVKLSPMSLRHTELHRSASEKMKILSALKRLRSEITLEDDTESKVNKIMSEIDKYPNLILENSIKIKTINNKLNVEKNIYEREKLIEYKKGCANIINHTLTKWNYVKQLVIIQGRYAQLSSIENKSKINNISIYVKDYEKKTSAYYGVMKEILSKDQQYMSASLVNKHKYLKEVEDHYRSISISTFAEILEGNRDREYEYTKDLADNW